MQVSYCLPVVCCLAGLLAVVQIEVQVVGPDGKPLNNVQVEIQSSPSRDKLTLEKTAGNGTFTLKHDPQLCKEIYIIVRPSPGTHFVPEGRLIDIEQAKNRDMGKIAIQLKKSRL
jgi:hypothetical protein